MSKVKDKEGILKEAREKQLVMYQGAPIRLSANFSTYFAGQLGVAKNIQSDEKQGPTTKISLLSKAII